MNEENQKVAEIQTGDTGTGAGRLIIPGVSDIQAGKPG